MAVVCTQERTLHLKYEYQTGQLLRGIAVPLAEETPPQDSFPTAFPCHNFRRKGFHAAITNDYKKTNLRCYTLISPKAVI